MLRTSQVFVARKSFEQEITEETETSVKKRLP